MKWILYIVLLLGAVLLPEEATDVGKLIPVEVVAVSKDRDVITIETDTGDWGQGRTIADAVGDMEDHASGVIYLDTAEYLIAEEETDLKQLRPYLKGDVRVCTGSNIQLEEVADYLRIHKPACRLKNEPDQMQLQVLREEKGRITLS